MRYKKRPLWGYITLAMVPAILIAGIYIFTQIHFRDYDEFAQSFCDSIEYASERDSLRAEMDGVNTKVIPKNAEKIRNGVLSGSLGNYEEIVPTGDSLTLEFGNGEVMHIWKKNSTVITVQYIYPDGHEVIFSTSDERKIRFVDFERLISVSWGNILWEE